ncbi:MAG: esterase-like activity of phytase family protein [Rhodobacteraceae bacterium]|nr:esterase-like activity of phytase family protein [Paracoccaceae bacterium]
MTAKAGIGALFGAMFLSSGASAAELTHLGTYFWTEERAGFGGFSGLEMAEAGRTLFAASDAGDLFVAHVTRGPNGAVTAIATDRQGRFLDNFGKPVAGFTADAEALALGPDGTLHVAFESYARIAAFHPPDMMPEAESGWDRFRETWGNAGFEALTILPDGRLMAVMERVDVKGGYPTFIGVDKDWTPGPAIPTTGGYNAAGADTGPDGRIYLLERKTDFLGRFSTRIRRLDLNADGFGDGEVLLETPPGSLDNMEGISLWRDQGGRAIITLISDDNFRFFQDTLVVEYVLEE